jgi:hypothetical protein
MSERRTEGATLDTAPVKQGLSTADLASTAPQQATDQTGTNVPSTEDAGQPAAADARAEDTGQPTTATARAEDTGQPAPTSGRAEDVGQPAAADARVSTVQSETGATNPLFPANDAQALRARWETIQISFVDEPRRAVEQADSLVADSMQRLAEIFSQTRTDLESQWGSGDNVSTEDLRQALQRYRTFFDRLLSV